MGALHSVAEPNEATRAKLAETYPDLEIYSELAQALASDAPAVAIATPASTHFDLARQALLAGKDVLVEKPITLDVEQARQLVALADEQSRVLMVGHLLIYQPAIEFIREAIASGLIGTLKSLHQERLNLGKARSEENALWSLGVHDVAVALYLVGSAPVDAQLVGQAVTTPGVEDDVYLHLRFDSGAMAHLHDSWLWPELRRRLTVIGTEGMLVFDEPNAQVVHHKKKIGPDLSNVVEGQEIVFEGSSQPLEAELRHFVECVESRSKPKTDGQSGVDVLQVLQSVSH